MTLVNSSDQQFIIAVGIEDVYNISTQYLGLAKIEVKFLKLIGAPRLPTNLRYANEVIQ